MLLAVQGALLATVDRVVPPLLGPRVVPVPVVQVGDALVVLLDAPLDLTEERLLELLRVGHHPLRVGVLGLEVRDDLRRLALVEPEVVVDPHVPVDLEARRGDACFGRNEARGHRGVGAHLAARVGVALASDGEGEGQAQEGGREAHRIGGGDIPKRGFEPRIVAESRRGAVQSSYHSSLRRAMSSTSARECRAGRLPMPWAGLLGPPPPTRRGRPGSPPRRATLRHCMGRTG